MAQWQNPAYCQGHVYIMYAFPEAGNFPSATAEQTAQGLVQGSQAIICTHRAATHKPQVGPCAAHNTEVHPTHAGQIIR